MTAQTPAIEEHPDIAALRLRYDRAAETPTAQIAEGLTLLSGLYLAVSPYVVGFTDHRALWFSNLYAGTALALLALLYASAYGRTHGLAWCAPVIGLWVIVSPWLVQGTADQPVTKAITNNVVVGALCVVFSLAAMSVTGMGSMRAMRTNRSMNR